MIKRKYVIIGIIAFVLLMITLIVFLLIPKSYIRLSSAPQKVSITIDGGSAKNTENGSTITVSPGKHIIVISQNEFDSYSEEVNINNGQTYELIVVLNPLTDAAKELLMDSKSRTVVEQLSGKIFNQQTTDMVTNYPILNILPIRARQYLINACPSQKYPDDITKVALCIESNQTGLESYVLKDIESRGYNPADYEIIWPKIPIFQGE